jgi:nicotinate-nucleotide adenylyltransferase
MLANYLCEFTDVEEVWLMVSPQNPLKETGSAIDSGKRLALLQLAVADDARLVASDFELNLPLPTYSIRTLTALRSQFPEREFSLLIGSDNWEVFDKWKDYQQIIAEFPIWIYPRLGSKVEIPLEYGTVKKLDAPIIELSSTFIRESIAQGKNMRRFVPEAVWNQIESENLYRNYKPN